MYNSEFQEFEIVQILKIQKKTTKFAPKNISQSKQLREIQQKRRKLFTLRNIFWSKFGRFFLYFEDLNDFEFLKFRINAEYHAFCKFYPIMSMDNQIDYSEWTRNVAKFLYNFLQLFALFVLQTLR